MARTINESQSVGRVMAKGIKVYKGKVATCENISGQAFKSGFVPDVGVKLEVEVGYDKPLTLMIFGRFNVENNERKGYVAGGVSSIAKFLSRMIKEDQVNDDWTLADDKLKEVVGKDIYLLRYTKDVYEKPNSNDVSIGWQTWDTVGNSNEEDLFKEFEDSLQRGYPKDFDETVIDQVNAAKDDKASSFDPNEFANKPSEFDEETPI